jgi:hydroxymethylglutaryl-CoA lyase
MTAYPSFVEITEVGPRDGLQLESRVLKTQEKQDLIARLVDAGIKEIEVGSFVNPKAVPQMADTDALLANLPPRPGVHYRALWLNVRGLDRAIATGKVAIEGDLYITASETFSRRNTKRGIEDALGEMPDWIKRYREAGIETDGLSVMAAFGCKFEGAISEETVIGLVERVDALIEENGGRLRRLTLADTMAWANPQMVKRRVGAIRERWPDVAIKLHLHDTRGMAMANAAAAMELGVTAFDSSIGGLGGCPFAGHTGAAGNICTEDLAHMCRELGIDTGIDLDKLVEAAQFAESLVGHELPGKVMKGGPLRQPVASATALAS